jgi:enoyl-CoA hydratase
VQDVDDDPYAAFERLRIEHPGDGVLLVTLEAPERLNATDAAMHRELSRVFRIVDDDERVRAVVVTGAGSAFSAGGDLDWIAEQVGDYGRTMAVMREAGDIVRTMIDCDTPIVSAINGVAVGAGLAVALMADVSVIDEDARLTDGHIRLGVGAGDHAVAVLDGREAERIGLVSKAVAHDEVLPTALAIAERLAAGPVDATRLTKRALNHWLRQALPNFEASLAYEMLNFLGPDAQEGLTALQEKRRPDFGRR